MKILILSALILMTLNLKSQTLQVSELDSAIIIADRLIETNPRVFFKNVESFIVCHDGKIRFEKYYHGIQKDSLHHIQSQTKSIVSLLLGIAIDEGFIKSENEPLKNYFPDYFSSEESVKSELKIKDILTMTAGFEWEEMVSFDDPENDNINMFNSNDYLQYVLSKPVSDSLYGTFNYNSGCPMIIAGIIEKATKMRLDKFAELYLFKSLGITSYRWIKDSTGFCHAGGGLYLKPEDMMKIGILMLNGGKYENRQIVTGEWIDRMTRPYVTTNFENSQYGYFWWIRNMGTGQEHTALVISAEGAGGQKLYIFPAYRLIVAFTERNYNTPQVSPIFIRESILPLLN